MLKYLIMRINSGHLNYEDVVKRFPHYRAELDKEFNEKEVNIK